MIKIKPPKSEQEYKQAKIDLAFSYAPSIYPCKTCKWPVAKGYCCGYCGDSDPSGEDEEY